MLESLRNFVFGTIQKSKINVVSLYSFQVFDNPAAKKMDYTSSRVRKNMKTFRFFEKIWQRIKMEVEIISNY